MRLAIGLALAVLVVAPAQAKETRCGWLQNPTPGNWWLSDKDASWTLATQGIESSDDVMNNLPPFDESEYVASNGNYGYGCACLSVETDAADERITRVYSGRTIPLSRCENDSSLPAAE